MHIYNEQQHHTKDKIFVAYSILLPEDSFWRQIDKIINFDFIVKNFRNQYELVKNLEDIDIIRLFKYQLLKIYYNLTDEELIKNTDIDISYKYFLEYEPMNINYLEHSLITSFGNLKPNQNLLEDLNLLNSKLSILKDIPIISLKKYQGDNIYDLAKIFVNNMKIVLKEH